MRLFQRPRVRNWLLIVAGLLAAGWLIPPLFHAGRYREALRAALENQLGRPVELGAVSFRLLPRPGFSIEDVLVKEEPRFGAEPFARVGSVECDLRWRSLWISRLGCAKIVLNHPVVNVVRNASGDWNLEGIFHRQSAAARPARSGAKRSSAAPSDIEVDSARINFTLNGTKKPFALDAVRANFGFDPSRGAVVFRVEGTPVRTDLTLLQPPGRIVVTGGWKPEAGFNGPFHARLTTSDSLLYAWIPLLARRDLGIYGLVTADIQFGGTARRVQVKGSMNVRQLHRWASLPQSSPAPLDLAFSGFWDRAEDRVEIQSAEATLSNSRLRLAGTIGHVLGSPNLQLALTVERSRLEDFMKLANGLAIHPARISVSGRVDGGITLDGPWSARRYSGSLSVRLLALRDRGVVAQSPSAEILIGERGARLLPAHFTLAPGIDGRAEGSLIPALPGGARLPAPALGRHRAAREARASAGAGPHYELTLTIDRAPLHRVVRLARAWGARGLQNLDATGAGDVSIRLSGAAWPFSRPQIDGHGHLESGRVVVAGLTEPIELSRFHFRIEHGVFSASDVKAGIGAAAFSGWLKRGANESGWQFAVHAPHLSLEQASLWFAVLGYQRPRPILDLIPGLRSLEGSRAASRSVFAAIDARGSFESPDVTFRSLTLRDFRAAVAIAGRVARVSSAAFETGAGTGIGSAEVDFRQAPARVNTQFELTGLRVQRFAARLPAALRGVHGVLSAAAHLTTRGLTRQEMAAHLQGAAELRCHDLNFEAFDPLEAAARAGSLGSLAPERRPLKIPALDMNLIVRDKTVEIVPTRVFLAGAALNITGRFGFDGAANLRVLADLSHVKRRWQLDPPEGGPQNRAVSLRLTGSLDSLAVSPAPKGAKTLR